MVKCGPGLGGLFHGFQCAGFVIFAVGEQHQDLVVVTFVFEGAQNCLNGFGQGRAALGNDADLEGVDALPEGLVIERERALQKRSAGKSHPNPAGRIWPGASSPAPPVSPGPAG